MRKKGLFGWVILLTIVGMPFLLLENDRFQQRLGRNLCQRISSQYPVEIQIDSLSLHLIQPHVELFNLVAADSMGYVFLTADRIESEITLRSLFSKKIEVKSLRLIGADIRLFKETPQDNINIAYLKDLLPSSQGETTPIKLSSVILKNCRFLYEVKSIPEQEEFDLNHISVENINAKFRMELAPHLSTLQVYHVGLEGKHGFQLKNLLLDLSLEPNRFCIHSIRAELPHSYVQSDSVILEYTDSTKINILQPFRTQGSLSTLDLSAFIQNLQLKDTANLIAHFDLYTSGTLNDINVNELHVDIEDLLHVEANLWLKETQKKGLASMESYWKQLEVNPEIVQLINPYLPHGKIILPAPIERLGPTLFKGFITASKKDITLSGDFQARPGDFSGKADVHIQRGIYSFQVNAQADNFDLQTLLETDIPFGESAFDIQLKGQKKKDKDFVASVNANIKRLRYNGYTYKNCLLKASYDGMGVYKGQLHSRDRNCRLSLNASFDKQINDILCDVNVKNANLHTMNWMKGKDLNSSLSFTMQAQLNGTDLNTLKGSILIDSLSFRNQGENFEMKYLSLIKREDKDIDYLLLRSDLGEGWIYGSFDLSKIWIDLQKNVLTHYLPALISPQKTWTSSGNQYEFKFTLNNTQALSNVLSLPLSIPDFALLEGHYNDHLKEVSIKFESNELFYKGRQIISPYILLNNTRKDYAQLLLLVNMAGKDDNIISLDMEAKAKENALDMVVKWYDRFNANQGEIQATNRFHRRNYQAPLTLQTHLSSPYVHLGDSLWTIDPSDWSWDGNRLNITNFQAHHQKQFIKINGILSKQKTDSLSVNMNDISLDDLFKLIPSQENGKSMLLGGTITANGKIASVMENPQIEATLSVDDFSLNHHVVGNLNGFSKWNNDDKMVAIDASVEEQGHTNAVVNGGYYPMADSIYLAIYADGFPIDFITSFIQPTLTVGGNAFGLVEVMAPLKGNRVKINTSAFVEDGSVEIMPLKSMYRFNDSIFITPHTIQFKKIRLSDAENNMAYLNGEIRHDRFSNMYMDLRMSMDQFKVADIKPSLDEPLYGTLYSTGIAMLTGPSQDLQLEVNARTDEKTAITISMQGSSEVNDYNFIEFIDKNTENDEIVRTEKSPSKRNKPNVSSSLNMNFQIEATPSAEIALLTNPLTGDAIKGRGTGSIRISYDQKNELSLYGRYELESGSYEFNLQDLIKKKFDILQGSSVNFSGDPLSGRMDIDATHTVINVSLTDLLDEADITSLNLNRTNIPVNCTLNLSGEIQQPNIQLGLDFPAADEELRRRILNVINTDEIMNRQIVYLLLLNRFAASENVAPQTTNNMTAVVGVTLNTLSNQINKMIYQALGTNNLSLDFNYQYEDYSNNLGEWQVAMTSQLLDNRLILNGNIGSREDLVNDNTQFIGDFDLEYKFSSSGRWRLKMFNRSNDSRYFKSAMTTQGVGVVYKESFNNLSELKQSFVERIAEQIIKSKKESDLKPRVRSSKK